MPRKKDEKIKCSICGNVNEGNNVFCGLCGKELNQDTKNSKQDNEVKNVDSTNAPEIDSSLEISGETQDIEAVDTSESDKSPQDATQISEDIEEGQVIAEVRQVKSAWIISSGPWLFVILAIMLYMEPITEVIAIMMAVVVVVPRFFLWLRTSYVLTENVLIYNRGGMIKTGTYKIPLSTITTVSENYGRFGRTLGYKSVVIKLANGASASLAYISPESDLDKQIALLIENNPEDSDISNLSESD